MERDRPRRYLERPDRDDPVKGAGRIEGEAETDDGLSEGLCRGHINFKLIFRFMGYFFLDYCLDSVCGPVIIQVSLLTMGFDGG
jgi:hypothetical protein